MHSWVTFASIIRLKSRNEGFVLRCRAGLSSYCAPGLHLNVVPPVLDCPRQLTVVATAPLEGEDLAVQFAEVSDAEIAGKLIGHTLLADTADLPDEALAVGPDVTGWQVIDRRFGRLGTVSEVVEGPAQDLLVVEAAGDTSLANEILIPFVDAFVLNEDADSRILTTAIPAGLLTMGAE